MAVQDPHSAVNGEGQRRLQDAGVVVETGLMQAASEELNPGFLQRMRSGRPWVRIKLAASLDGRTALTNGDSRWISSDASRLDVQLWRARSSAILTGIGTVLSDDPRMTVRLAGDQEQPLRVIVDSCWRTPVTAQILGEPGSVIIAGSENQPVPRSLGDSGARLLGLPEFEGKPDLRILMRSLADEQVNELQVEAGANLCGSLLQSGLVDEILLYQAPVVMGEGGKGLFEGFELASMQQKIGMQLIESRAIGPDTRLRLRPLKAIEGSS